MLPAFFSFHKFLSKKCHVSCQFVGLFLYVLNKILIYEQKIFVFLNVFIEIIKRLV